MKKLDHPVQPSLAATRPLTLTALAGVDGGCAPHRGERRPVPRRTRVPVDGERSAKQAGSAGPGRPLPSRAAMPLPEAPAKQSLEPDASCSLCCEI